MAEKYPSSENECQLCSVDQENPGSCVSPSCYNFHMCRDYLLKNKCLEFELNGKCSHSHSLFTRHNQKILEKNLKLSAKNGDTFDRVSQLIQNSKSNSSERISSRSSYVDDDREFESSGDRTSAMSNGRGRGRSSAVLRKTSSDHPTAIDAARFSISPRLSTLTNSDYSQKSLTNSERFSNSLNLDIMDRRRDREEDDQRKSSARHSLDALDTDENNDMSSTARPSSRSGKSFASTVRSFVSKVKDIMPTKPDPKNTVRTDPQLKYIFDRFSRDDELSYAHGPLRQYLVDKNYQIFPSGYCRLVNADQEREIENKLNVVFPIRLRTDRVQLPNDDLTFFICTSAAEKIFERIYSRDKKSYSIISEPYSSSLSIEVRRLAKDDRPRSSSAPSRRGISTRLPNDRETPLLSTPDGKFRISQTNSSIDVIRGDITNIPVDLLVCVTTSGTLLDNVLTKAGQTTISEYKRRSYSKDPVVLSGGLTLAKGILFIPWKFEVESSDSRRAQQSLSDLVRRCINEAHRLNMASIAFPSIGTGQIGLNPDKVSESMISAANECLHRYKMDVSFVIYSTSKSNDPNEQSYQAFRNYLDGLCRQSRPVKAEASSVVRSPRGSTIPVEKCQQIRRDPECKRISTVSASSDMTFDHRQLLKSLEELIVEKTIKLSLIQQQFIDEVESLIDLCLDYHVIPHIDYVKDKLTVHGDLDSCSQCLSNLQNRSKIYKYFTYKKTAKGSQENDLNMYVSMKIDEAIANDESNISIEDGSDTILHVDINDYKIQINDDAQHFGLGREHLNADSRIVPPSSWSPSLVVRTIDTSLSSTDSKKCLRLFERTMPTAEWHVERIDAIENWPLYVHYNSTKIQDEVSTFHGCSYSSVQSIIHYGLHSNFGQSSENSIQLTYDALDSHIQNARRSTDGTHYMFIVRLEKKHLNNGFAKLSNHTAHLALPTHLIVYRREIVV